MRRTLLKLAFLLPLLAACADGASWSQREIDNAGYLLTSLQAASEAARLSNAMGDVPSAAELDALLRELRQAYVSAAQVDDQVLDKLHPRLYAEFRLGYQKALGNMIRAYEQGDMDAAAKAAGEIGKFTQWYRAERHNFRWWKGAPVGN